ncbi:MAG: protein TolQ [Thermodesulfobacteriota bacterium]
MNNWIYYVTQIPAGSPADHMSVLGLVTQSGPVVKGVLLLLLIMSVVSWAIIFSKYFVLKRATKSSEKFLELYSASGNFGNLYTSTKHMGGPIAEVFRAGYTEILKIRKSRAQGGAQTPEPSGGGELIDTELGVVELVERALKRTMASEISKLESSLTFLATTGSAAPFIGLFGTVWGIMTSFIGLAGSQGVPTLQAVAPGIAEALIATAVGLAAAIPAVIGYNYSLSRVKKIDVDMENFSSEFLNIVDRYVKKV